MKKFLTLCTLFAALATPAAAVMAQSSGSNTTVFAVPFSQSIDFVDGLASNTLVDSLLVTPKRVSDTRFVTALGLQGMHAANADTTVDFGYGLQARHYLNNAEFNLVNNKLGAGVTRRVNAKNTVSLRGDINRSFAGSSYDPYYWMGHAGVAWAQSYTPRVSAVYGADVMRYAFDDADGLNTTQVQLSATPSYIFETLPLRASVLLRVTDSAARDSFNGFQSFEIAPQLTYLMPSRHGIDVGVHYGRARFDGEDSVQPVMRRDETYGFSVAYFAPLGQVFGENVAGIARYSYSRNDSNVDRQDYDTNAISLGVGMSF